MDILKNSLRQSHDYVEMIVKKGDVVIDATAGNGKDTCFLASLVGKEGRVYAFDIQKEAIEATRVLLLKQGLLDCVELIKDGHQNLDKYVKSSVSCVMFNLGYRPGGEHRIATDFNTTKDAIQKSLDILMFSGIITIVVYHGKDSGSKEKDALLDFVKSLDPKRYKVMETQFMNQVNNPPILVCIQKTKHRIV